MKVLILCESSGTVREAFRSLGHDAWSSDILPADDGSTYHMEVKTANTCIIKLKPPGLTVECLKRAASARVAQARQLLGRDFPSARLESE